MFARFWLAAVLPMVLMAGASEGDEPLFPFVISYDAPDNVTNISVWLDRPACRCSGYVMGCSLLL